jgi:hypothetical protein
MIRVVVPYTKEVVDSIIYEYQEFFYPLQFTFIFLAFLMLYFIWKNQSHKIIVSILAFFWIWIGAIYEIKYYFSINWFGLYIGYFFILQALLLLWFGMIKKELIFVKNKISLIIVSFLTFFYPIVQIFAGTHHYEISIIGMLPNITVAFTLIILFMNTQKNIKTLFIIPIVWSVFSLYWNYLILFN